MLFSELLRFLWEGLVIEAIDPSDHEIARRLGVEVAVMRERALSDAPLSPWDLEMLLLAWNATAEGHSVVMDGERLRRAHRPEP